MNDFGVLPAQAWFSVSHEIISIRRDRSPRPFLLVRPLALPREFGAPRYPGFPEAGGWRPGGGEERVPSTRVRGGRGPGGAAACGNLIKDPVGSVGWDDGPPRAQRGWPP